MTLPPPSAKLRWWHEALADFYLANPTATNQEAADFFSKQPSTISAIKNSDAFKAFFALRVAENRENLDLAIRNRLMNVTSTTLDALHDRLKLKRGNLDTKELTTVLDSVGNLVNGGNGHGRGGVTIVNSPTAQTTMIAPVSVDDLRQAQAALRQHQNSIANKAQVLEGEVLPPVAKVASPT